MDKKYCIVSDDPESKKQDICDRDLSHIDKIIRKHLNQARIDILEEVKDVLKTTLNLKERR